MTSPTELLRRAVASDPARPRLTWYDAETGERVELSGATLTNWVNKTAHLLVAELGAVPGDVVAIDLPRHWLAAVWWLAVDAVGATPILGADPTATVAVLGPSALTSVPPNDEVVAVSLLPMAGPFRESLPAMVRDYAIDVRGQADQFTPSAAGDHAAGDRAQQLAAGWGLTATDRLLAVGALTSQDDLDRGLLAPLAADASVVWVRNQPGRTLVQVLATERVTVGIDGPPSGPLQTLQIRWLSSPSVSC